MIQGKSVLESITVFDPVIGKRREVSLDNYVEQLRSLGLSDEDIEARVTEQVEAKRVALGLSDAKPEYEQSNG